MFKTIQLIFAAIALSLSFQANALLLTIDDTSENNLSAVSGTLGISFALQGGIVYLISMTVDNTSNTGTGGSSFDHVSMTGFALEILSPSNISGAGSSDSWDEEIDPGLEAHEGSLDGFSIEAEFEDFSDDAEGLEAAFASAYEAGTLDACLSFTSIPETGDGSGTGEGSDVACLSGSDTPRGRIPEPSAILLFAAGLVGFGLVRRKVKT